MNLVRIYGVFGMSYFIACRFHADKGTAQCFLAEGTAVVAVMAA